ncbi:hypothetical protein Y032_0088g2157 [Ancylostoma ceylanicum]|uniref:G-protein coupled receptors family 1 profile domain-containing protein n=2 Tax=Ancylostoma ceylanicum TaxID=53326 RepID=A0A016TNL2_9BILA|nr:hypothetical protein Y032_0088g2157 [Ancylostoma ceylanicum]
MIVCDTIDPNPSSYIIAMKIISIFSPIPTLVALFCIITCPARMGSQYRINLLLYQIWSLLFDFVFSLCVTPVLFYPMTMGYLAGIGRNFNGSLYPLTVFIFLNIALIGVAVLNMLLTRYYAIIPAEHFLRKHSKAYIILVIGWYIMYIGSLTSTGVLIYPNILENSPNYEKKFTCAAAVMVYAADSFQYTSFMPLVYNAAFLLIFTLVVGCSLIYLTFSAISASTHLSEKTKNLQRVFLIHVVLQGMIPIVFLAIPILILLSIFVFSIVNTQSIGNVCMCTMALCGTVSGAVVLIFNKPYQKHLIYICTVVFVEANTLDSFCLIL